MRRASSPKAPTCSITCSCSGRKPASRPRRSGARSKAAPAHPASTRRSRGRRFEESGVAYDRNNVFARILRGEIPCRKVYEDQYVLAFHDINPASPVHILVIPKGEYVSLDDFSATASEAELAGFIRALGAIARQHGVAETGYRILANHGQDAHQEVPHFHVHIFGGRN